MEHPLRILHAVVNMNRGGAETLIMNVYRNIDRSAIQFDFLTCKEGSFDEEIRSLGGTIYRIPYVTEVGHFKYLKALEDFFTAQNHYKIVHAHMDKMSGFVLRAAKKAGIPIRVAHSHNTSSEGRLLAKGYKWYAGRFIPSHASHFFACSNKASKWLYGKKEKEATVLKNGIDCHRFFYSRAAENQIKQELSLNNDSFIVGHIGRFCHQKNHFFLIDIFRELLHICPNAFLIMAGDGPLRPLIEKRVADFGIQDHVRFLGIRNDVERVLQAFDVLIFPSHHEGLPVTLIEAQSTGVPCLISDDITIEVDIGAKLISYERLNSSAKVWALKALLLEKERRANPEHIKKTGYDIQKSTLSLQHFYLQI